MNKEQGDVMKGFERGKERGKQCKYIVILKKKRSNKKGSLNISQGMLDFESVIIY